MCTSKIKSPVFAYNEFYVDAVLCTHVTLQMLISRIESYEKENVLLKEQIALMSKEVKLLRVEKEVLSQCFAYQEAIFTLSPTPLLRRLAFKKSCY